MNTSHLQLAKRYLLLCIGLAVMAFGVGFSIKGSLGTSPISSFPYVISVITPLTVGNATILMHCFFIFLQIVILRKEYPLIQLLQLPVAILFGYLTDFSVWTLQRISCSTYWQQWLACIVGILLVAVGVSCEVKANVVVLAGEGVVLAVCRKLPIKFGYMKVLFDVTLVVASCIVSLAVTGRIQGVREGTVAAAVFVGLLSKQILKLGDKWKKGVAVSVG